MPSRHADDRDGLRRLGIERVRWMAAFGEVAAALSLTANFSGCRSPTSKLVEMRSPLPVVRIVMHLIEHSRVDLIVHRTRC
jgi:hypothetical protein